MPASVQLLIDKGADVNARGGLHGTPLRAASYRGFNEVIGLLLENGAEINNTELEDQNTAQIFREEDLKTSSRSTRIKMIQGIVVVPHCKLLLPKDMCRLYSLLLDKGAQINTRVENSSLLRAKITIEADSHGNALQAAARNGHFQVAKVLLKQGADPNIQCGKYGTALQAASYANSLPMIKILLESGADPATTGGEYGTALIAACSRGSEPISRMLLQRRADPHYGSGKHGTALQAASRAGSVPLVILLLKYGLDLLLAHGANPNVTGGFHGSPLQAAASGGSIETAQFLLDL
ncbi:MAG: hypothetical protein Q9228_003069 [Teloschistes exilis]